MSRRDLSPADIERFPTGPPDFEIVFPHANATAVMSTVTYSGTANHVPPFEHPLSPAELRRLRQKTERFRKALAWYAKHDGPWVGRRPASVMKAQAEALNE